MQDFTPFQNYKVQGGPEFGQRNVPKLRAALKAANLDGFLIPHEDEYQNEYLPDCFERLMWATGFSGSAGAGIVMEKAAAIFVDGRYSLQVQAQVDPTLFSYQRLEEEGMAEWLRSHVQPGQLLGYDPKLHSPRGLAVLEKAVRAAGGTLTPVEQNPIDQAWTDRPPLPLTPVTIFPSDVAGRLHDEKRSQIAENIKALGADVCLLTAPTSIAWLLNIRGSDVMCTPLSLATALIDAEGHVDLFIRPEKISDEVRQHLGNQVSLHNEDAIEPALQALKGRQVLVDPSVSSAWHFTKLSEGGATILKGDDPVALPKACKNSAEIAGTTEAHKRDGAALVHFLHWLDTKAQSGSVDEIEAAQTLEGFRHQTGVLKDLSFETISGAAANGAIVHYRASEATTKRLETGSLFLVDSGGQYLDGTTDVTRTVPIGTPTAEMCERFTLVLKGHIALATVQFPVGTTGSNLDCLARAPLWSRGLDYDHGTGHGVGVFLGVHEGPQRISKAPNTVALRPGMIVSNEPGYYKTGAYGIRIENLQYVTEPTAIKDGERKMMGFTTLTLAPIHKTLIDLDILSRDEIDYINAYHQTVWTVIGPRVSGDVKDWLKQACAAL